MNAKRAALLHDVIASIVDSGYAEPLRKPKSKRQHIARREQIEVLSYDPRIVYRSNVNINLVTYVSTTYRVSRGNARMMLYRARRAAQAQKSAGD